MKMTNPELRETLMATTGTLLVEANPYDQVWGVGLAADDPRIFDRSQWRGQNLLGKILTAVLDQIQLEQASQYHFPRRRMTTKPSIAASILCVLARIGVGVYYLGFWMMPISCTVLVAFGLSSSAAR